MSFSLIFPSLFQARSLPAKTEVSLQTPPPSAKLPRPQPKHGHSSASSVVSSVSASSETARRVTFQLNQTNLLGLTETAEPEQQDDEVTVINSPSSSEFPLKEAAQTQKERRRFSMPKLIKRKSSPVSTTVNLPKISPALKTAPLPKETATPTQRPRRLSLLFHRRSVGGVESESESPTTATAPRRPRSRKSSTTAASDTETALRPTKQRVVSLPAAGKKSKPPVAGTRVTMDRHARMAASTPYRTGGWSDSER